MLTGCDTSSLLACSMDDCSIKQENDLQNYDQENDLQNYDFFVVNSINYKDFVIEFLSTQYIYEINKMLPESPLSFSVSVTYVGESDKVEIWHGHSVCCFTLLTAEGTAVLEAAIPDERLSTIQYRNVPNVVSWTGKNEYMVSDGLAEGQYSVLAYISFSLDEKNNDIFEATMEIPIVIK